MIFSFKTDKFNVTEEETEDTGDYRYGKELSEFLVEKLKLRKNIDGETLKYKNISIEPKKDFGRVIVISDNFFRVEINVLVELIDVEMKEDKTPLNVSDLQWFIVPNVYINLFSYKSYYNLLTRSDIFDFYYNQLAIDLEYIMRESDFKLMRVLD